MITIQLTKRQHRQLRKHFEIVKACYRMKPFGGDEDYRGILAAQVREEYGGESAYMQVKFMPRENCPKLQAATTPRVPNGWAGIPPWPWAPKGTVNG